MPLRSAKNGSSTIISCLVALHITRRSTNEHWRDMGAVVLMESAELCRGCLRVSFSISARPFMFPCFHYSTKCHVEPLTLKPMQVARARLRRALCHRLECQSCSRRYPRPGGNQCDTLRRNRRRSPMARLLLRCGPAIAGRASSDGGNRSATGVGCTSAGGNASGG